MRGDVGEDSYFCTAFEDGGDRLETPTPRAEKVSDRSGRRSILHLDCGGSSFFKKMNMQEKKHVLIACERSQVECKAFLAAGFDAYSCDILPCEGGRPDRHIMMDARLLMRGSSIDFITEDGVSTCVPHWDLLIAHPPCTYLSKVSSTALFHHEGGMSIQRLMKMDEGRALFYSFLDAPVPCVAVENPRPMRRAMLPPCSQEIQPFDFGHPWSKATRLWLKNLPPLLPTHARYLQARQWVRYNGWKNARRRELSFSGIADAMVLQWGGLI